jgi:hypothetical protein
MMNIGKLGKSDQTGKQTSDFSGDGRDKVTTTMLALFGTAYRAKSGSLICTLPVDGNEGNTFSIAPQPTDGVPDLAEGESATGNFAAKSYFWFRNSGDIECYIKGTKVFTINSESITGVIDLIMQGISLIHHTHPQNSGNHFGGGVSTGESQ